MSSSSQSHGLPHTRLLCPSPSSRVCSSSCALNQWCHYPLLLLPSIFTIIRIFSNESAVHIRWPKYWSVSFSISPGYKEYPGLISFKIDWLALLAFQGTLKSLLQHHNLKASILQHSAFFMVQLSCLYMTTGKTIALTIRNFVIKVMSLLFYTLSRFFITFLPRSNHLISWLQSPSIVILEPKKRKSVTASTFSSSICHEVKVPDAMILGFFFVFFWYWVLSRLFHSPPSPPSRGSLVPLRFSAIRVASFTYLRLFMFLQTVLIPACNSSSPAFHMMCSVYKLNKYGDNKQPCTPFSVLNQSFVPYEVLTVASWPAYKFLRRQVRWSGISIF